MFIDSDIAWKAMDLMFMMHTVSERDDIRIFVWTISKENNRLGKSASCCKTRTRMIEKDPTLLEKIAGDMVFNVYNEAYPDGQAPIFEPVRKSKREQQDL